MSILRLSIGKTCGSLSRILSPSLVNPFHIAGTGVNHLSTSAQHCDQHHEQDGEQDKPTRTIDPSKDRSIKIDVETSMRYMRSNAFKETYGDHKVWELYRRNHKGHLPPTKTRKTCIKRNEIRTGNPCPICRDQYLVLDYTNLPLLHHFISEHTGQVLSYTRTGICQRAHRELIIAVERAHDRGLIQLPVDFRYYNYSEYFKTLKPKEV